MVDKKELATKIKRANARLAYMRKKGYDNLSVVPLALREHGKITGADKPSNFKMGRKTSVKKLEQIDRQIDKFLNSKWTTSKGRSEILEKRLDAFTRNAKQSDKDRVYNMSRKQALTLFDTFATDVYEKAASLGMLDSRQLVDIIKSTNASADKIEKALTDAYTQAVLDGTLDAIDAFEYVKNQLETE
jgi:hypothetical protein